jgi:hypothetical protein
MANSAYDILFTPIQLGSQTLKERLKNLPLSA